MSLLEIAAITGAGVIAGMINVVVGSGTLVTFPTLLFFGYPPVAANISNSLGLVAGGLSGVWGYRRELATVREYVLRLVGFTFVGAIAGALLLLVLPEAAFEAVVPVLIVLALVLVVAGPRLNRWLSGAQVATTPGENAVSLRPTPGRWAAMMVGTLLAGVYGGYFGAAQGVLLIGLLSVLAPLGLQQLNGLKNLLVTVANLVAAAAFLIVATDQVLWWVVLMIAAGSLVGGAIGAKIGRSLPPALLRTVIVVVGLVAIVVLLR